MRACPHTRIWGLWHSRVDGNYPSFALKSPAVLSLLEISTYGTEKEVGRQPAYGTRHAVKVCSTVGMPGLGGLLR